MTFDEMVARTLGRLNLTSVDATTRVGVNINERYKKVTSSIGLLTSRRVNQDLTLNSGSTNPDLPDLTVTGMEKVLRVTRTAESGAIQVLKELSYDSLTNNSVINRLPTSWAVKRIGSWQVTITLDAFPVAADFSLHLEGYELADVLSGTAEPAFPESFHDILIEGALSDELRKMEKPQLAQMAEANYQQRLSDLRMFIAKSAYQDIYSGKDKPGVLWYRPWFSRISIE